MSGSVLMRRQAVTGPWMFLRATEASALAEFAISLPLLVVLVVGIFDFGGAFNQKQQLSNAMREAARFGASEATNDLANTVPPSVDAIRSLVDSYLVTAQLNDCGLSGVAGGTGGALTWIYTGPSCPGGGSLTLTIIRGFPSCALQATNYGGSSNPIASLNIPCTQVSISYPYQWHFNSVIQLLVPGATLGLTPITARSTAVNMN
jgi:TadE-like protein